MQRQSNGYDEPSFNDSYGEGMLNMNRPTGGDYGNFQPGSEYGREQNSIKSASSSYQNGRAYDYNEKSDRIYDNADMQALESANYKQTYDYDADGYDYAQSLPQGDDKRYSREQEFSSTNVTRDMRHTPLAGNQAYSSSSKWRVVSVFYQGLIV